MSFHVTSKDIRLSGKSILCARLQNESGEWVESEVNLDDFLGNNDGRFEWGGRAFSETAEWVNFHIEGGASVPVLRAGLRTEEGNIQEADVNLSERLANEDGRFAFI